MYRDRSLLWDPINSKYKNKNKRHDGLMEIAISFGMEKFDVEKNIKNLQSQFAREKKKEKESRKTGSGADEAYTSKWFGYDSMLFLADKNTPKNTHDTELCRSTSPHIWWPSLKSTVSIDTIRHSVDTTLDFYFLFIFI
ncbi:MADF domain [Cinara cedri]|uniref:MADF domain n=1 Tax=Cinara cedri TaxID=506608 RepID=A0A5E4LXJ8_9HEMI|nr:MADF domain [Cinara cedri]